MKDLSGKRFGRLTAIEPTGERKHGYVVWKCRCDCGGYALVQSGKLTSGHTMSCGCLAREKAGRLAAELGRKSLIDLRGKRFSRLVVLERVGCSRQAKWKCVCDCGSQAVVPGNSLVTGRTRSCGCLRRETSARAGMARHSLFSPEEIPRELVLATMALRKLEKERRKLTNEKH